MPNIVRVTEVRKTWIKWLFCERFMVCACLYQEGIICFWCVKEDSETQFSYGGDVKQQNIFIQISIELICILYLVLYGIIDA
jgi:hypothetical protein